MRKFSTVLKEKQTESIKLHESKILSDFSRIYDKMLEAYETVSVNNLDDTTKAAFMTELNEYWNEDEGMNDRGRNYLNDNCVALTEKSTSLQKKKYLKKKASIVIESNFNRSNLKYNLYDVLDEMYKQINGENIKDVLSPKAIVEILKESMDKVTADFIKNVEMELTESSK